MKKEYYSDRKVKMEYWIDERGRKNLSVYPGYRIYESDDVIFPALEDLEPILKILEGKRFRVPRRWFLKKLREFVFSGHSIIEFMNKSMDNLEPEKFWEFNDRSLPEELKHRK